MEEKVERWSISLYGVWSFSFCISCIRSLLNKYLILNIEYIESFLTFYLPMSSLYRNQLLDLRNKSADWFPEEEHIGHWWVNIGLSPSKKFFLYLLQW